MVPGGLDERRRSAATAPSRREWLVAAGAGGPAFALYLALGWVRFSTGHSGNYDLGIFAQAAQHWARGEWPGSGIRSLSSLFADHFSPVTILFGLGWLIWPDPRSLLVVQSAALALAVALAGAAAARHLPLRLAVPVTAASALAKGLISAASFDVHETALGTPLVAGLAWGLLERRRRVVLGCAAASLLVKEDLGLTVLAAAAVWWCFTGDRRTALSLAALGLGGLVAANAVISWVAPGHRSPYLQFLFGASGNPQGLHGAAVLEGSRWAPGLLFGLAAGAIGLRSPLALLALPTLAWRAASSNVSYWQTYFHYDALLVPIAALALTDVLRRPAGRPAEAPLRATGWSRGWWHAAGGVRARGQLRGVLLTGALVWSAWIGLAKVAAWQPWDPHRYELSAPMRDATALGQLVPRGSAVVAQQDLGPAVLARVDVRMLTDTVPAWGRWVLLTSDGSQLGAPLAAKRHWLAVAAARPGVTIVRRGTCVLVGLPAQELVRL
jgi:hypothetical protein